MDDNLWVAKLFCLFIIMHFNQPCSDIKHIDFSQMCKISINIHNIAFLESQILLRIPFNQINRPLLMIQPIMPKPLIKLGNEYIISLKILQMCKRDIHRQWVGLVAFIVEDIKWLVVLDDHDAPLCWKLIKFEGCWDATYFLYTVLIY